MPWKKILGPVDFSEGSRASLGHPRYGSRLVTLIGAENNVTNRNLARLFTLYSLKQESRVREVLDHAVEPKTN